MFRIVILLFVFTISVLPGQDIFINEFMASNDTTITDPYYNQAGDWIELYNAGSSELDLNGCYLTDNPDDPQKWQFMSSQIVAPFGHLLIWADGFGHDEHTSFKLAREGEFIGLYSPELNVIDTLSYSLQQTDISYGRYPDGGGDWFFFNHASPGQANGDDGFSKIAPVPQFSHPSGKYDDALNVTLSTELDSAQIYYTIDGSIPDKTSRLYSDHVHIRYSQPIRARVYREGYLPGKVITKTYLMFTTTELPIVALSTDPDNFFDDEIGIYVIGTNGITGYCVSEPRNWNQDWERPVHFDFFDENGAHLIDQDAGVKISGGCSRLYPQKSLELVARNIYGDDRFHYRMFEDKPIHEFKNFILRSSAQDWWRSMIRDGLLHTLVSKSIDNLDYQAYRPAVVYLNGQYWGIHNIREKSNENYLYYNRGLDPDNLDIVKISKYGYATAGDIEAYTEMMTFVENNDLSREENYAHMNEIMDMDNYINYQIYEIYIANRDWPCNNLKLYRERVPGSQWRWWLYDLDMGFAGNGESRYYSNILAQAMADDGPNWPNPPWSTLLFRRLLENDNFRYDFIQRFAVYLSATFKPEYVVPVIDSIRQQVASEIPAQKDRWEKSMSYGSSWQDLLDLIYEFAYLRPEYMMDHLKAEFNLSEPVPVTIEPNIVGAGMISANGVMIKHLTDTLQLFPDIPLALKVQALPGYKFRRWESPDTHYLNDLIIIPEDPMTIKAIFAKDTTQSSPLVINEINFNSSALFDPGDWVELYNNSDMALDISGWYFLDSQDDAHFVIPEGTVIAEDGYLVLCRDTISFMTCFPGVTTITGDFPFGLNGDSELVRLYNKFGQLVDSLTYKREAPWPNQNDGHTIALKHPRFDNSLGRNWKLSEKFGTPGEINDAFLGTEDDRNKTIVKSFELDQNYPNPFNPVTAIGYRLSAKSNVELSIYNMLGQRIKTLVSTSQSAGEYKVEWDAGNLASGIYYYHLIAGQFHSIKKMVLIK